MPRRKTPLTPRELVVGLRLYLGLSTREVAELLGISVQAVYKHEARVKKEIEQWQAEKWLREHPELDA